MVNLRSLAIPDDVSAGEFPRTIPCAPKSGMRVGEVTTYE